jgi:hypothetical protein
VTYTYKYLYTEAIVEPKNFALLGLAVPLKFGYERKRQNIFKMPKPPVASIKSKSSSSKAVASSHNKGGLSDRTKQIILVAYPTLL